MWSLISLWDTKEHAEAYNTAGYPEVMKSLEPLLDGSPKLRVSDIVNSTFHKVADGTAVPDSPRPGPVTVDNLRSH